MLYGSSLAPHSSQHAGRCSLAVSHHKGSRHGCFDRPGTQGSAISAFNPLAAQQCVSCQLGFSSSVCQAVVGATRTSMSRVYQQCWREWASWCAQQGLPNNAISAPKLANFLLHLFQVGLDWHTIGIYLSPISAFLEPHCIHKASNHPVISKLMHHFYYSILLLMNGLILGMWSTCYLFWKVGHLHLLLLPLSWLGRLLLFWHLLLQSIVLI